MKHNTCLPWLAVICGLLLSLQGCRSQPADTVTLSELLMPPGCESACWQGIEPGVTTRDEFDDYIENNDINYKVFTILGDDYFSWPVLESPLSRDEGDTTITVAASETRDVGYILMQNVNLCVSTVIREFGFPDRLVEESFYTYILQYPDRGISFDADSDLRYVRHLDIRAGTMIREQFVFSPFIDDESKIESLISTDCTDRFNP